MTIRERLADAIRRELSWLTLETVNPVRVADVLLSVPGIAVVELPQLMEDLSGVAESIRNQPMWALNDAWATVTDEGEIELEADGQELYGTLGTARDARDLAAVLLAAADEAEGQL